MERNRIVSGLSLGVLVIEAMHRSGTSVTSKLAISQDRKTFALPHEIWNSHGTGTNRLLKNGAILVTDTEDILQEISSLKKLQKKLNTIQRINLSSLDVDYEIFENLKKTINSPKSKKSFAYNEPNNPFDISSKKVLENKKLSYIYDLISTTPISINEICKKTSKPISEISKDLFTLELEGYIKKVAGGYVCILNK